MGCPRDEVKGKTIAVGVQGSNGFQLSVWLQSLHLHLGQITQCGLPTTSVCMTNHCDRASLQPTQLNTYACEQTKTHSYGHKSTCSPLITNTEPWTLYSKLSLHDSTKPEGTFESYVVSFKANLLFLCCILFWCCWLSLPVKDLQKGKSLHH